MGVEAIQFDPARDDFLCDGRDFPQLIAELTEDDPRWREAAKMMSIVIKSLRWKIAHMGGSAEGAALSQHKSGYAEGWANASEYYTSGMSGSDYYRLRDKYNDI